MPSPQPQGLVASSFNGPLDLLNQDYPSKSIDNNQSRLTNMYLEPDKSKGKYALVAYSMFGLELFCDTAETSVRAMLEQNEVLYVVAGNHFYSVDSSGTKTQLGTLNTSSGFAKMAAITGASDNNNQIVIIDGTNGYHWNIGTSTGQFPILDVDFPQTATDICSMDDYFIVKFINSITFAISAVSDGTNWSSLDFASKTGLPDRLTAIAVSQRKLYLMGSKTIEPYYDSGNVDFPFEKVLDIIIQHGVAAKRSVTTFGEDIIFLAKTQVGGYQVIRLNNYQMTPISNPAYDYQISNLTTKSDAIGYCYSKDGHDFYDLTFPTDARTFTFDLLTGAPLTRKSYISGGYTRFLGQCQTFCYDKSLVGDYQSGKIFTQKSTVYTENGTSLLREFISPIIYFQNKRIFVRKLLIDVECGVGANKTFTLEKSYDDGRTWVLVNTFTIGTDNTTRLYANGLGSARSWMFRISTTMDANFTILGFQADAQLGSN